MANRTEKTARNRAIVEAWLDKTPIWDIAKEHHICYNRVCEIVRYYKLRALRQARRPISTYSHGERGRKVL